MADRCQHAPPVDFPDCTLRGAHHQTIDGPTALTEAQKIDLSHVLLRVKQQLLGTSCAPPTNEELKWFLVSVFNMWTSGARHTAPDSAMLKTSLSSKNVEVAVLNEACPSGKEVTTELKRRGVPTGIN